MSVAQALHWFDRPRFFAEVQRVLVPGRALCVWSYDDPSLDNPAANDVLQSFNHETLGAWWPAERALVGLGSRRIDFPFAEVEAPMLTMTCAWTAAELTGYVGSWSAVTRYRAAIGSDPVPAFADTLARAWGDSGVRRTVRWPLVVRAGHRDG